MTALDKIASALGRRDEVPNQELARSLAASGDAQAVAEIASGLQSRQGRPIASRCCMSLDMSAPSW
jgi:hypothetical protein